MSNLIIRIFNAIANDVWKCDLVEFLLFGDGRNLSRLAWYWRFCGLPTFEQIERHADDVRVFGRKLFDNNLAFVVSWVSCFIIALQKITHTPQGASGNLLAQ